MELYVKYMVCLRSRIEAKQEFVKLNPKFKTKSGYIETIEEISEEQQSKLKKQLHKKGLQLLDRQTNTLIKQIKNTAIELAYSTDALSKEKYAEHLSQKLGYEYHYLAQTFSEVKGFSIEQYILSHKVERVKEYIIYEGLTLKEIAKKMHYSSAESLSYEFEKVTGLKPSYFLGIKKQKKKLMLQNL